jgi:dihydrofolate synthase/folylpolyglutamate synthase
MTFRPSIDISSLLSRLFSLHRFGIKPGLERTLALLELLDNPHTQFPAIHVAGTNGKGSTCSLLASILTAAGYKTGLYTSPHIKNFNERIRINGTPIADEDIARLALPLLNESEKAHTTFFEITTAMAFAYFAEQNVDIAIIETGLGGRLDSTNVLAPLLSIITSIDLDHTQYLGFTLDSITKEKAAIIKQNTPAIIAEPRIALRPIFSNRAKDVSAPILFLHDTYSAEVTAWNPDFSMEMNVQTPNRTFQSLRCNVAGLHQTHNILATLAALDTLSNQFPTTEYDIRRGCEQLQELSGLSARIQLLRANPPLVIDVGHNPAGLRKLVETLALCGYADTQWNVVFGVMADKNVEEMLSILQPITAFLYAAAPLYDRALSADELAEKANSIGINATSTTSVANALNSAIAEHKPTLIVGSFYLADEALSELSKYSFGV